MRRALLALMTGCLLLVGPNVAAVPGDLHLASVTQDGVKGAWSTQPSLSADGSRVAFSSGSSSIPPTTTTRRTRTSRISVSGIPDGGTVTVRVTLTARKPATLANRVTATPIDFDPDGSNNSDSETTVIVR